MSVDLEIDTGDSANRIDKLVSSVEKLVATMQTLGSISGPDKLKQQVDALQASVTTGFAEIANKVDDFGKKIRADREKSNDAILQAQVAHDNKLHAQANKFHDRQIQIEVASENQRAATLQALIEKRDVEELASRTSASVKLQALVEKRDLEEYASRSAASAALQAVIEKRDLEEYTSRSTAAARLQAIIEKRDLEEYTERTAAGERLKALTERQQLELYQIKATAQERERVLNTNFLTSSLAQQISAAEKAAVYTGQGGNAAAKFGGAAAGADIAALRAQQEALTTQQLLAKDSAKLLAAAQVELGVTTRVLVPATAALAGAQIEEALSTKQLEGAFRGAAHEMGLFGLAHGQILALLAGAGLAAALHHIAVGGAEVQYSLASLTALSTDLQTVDVNKFIAISSGSLSSLKDAAEGVHALAQAGVTAKEALTVLPDLLRLSALGELSVAQAAEVAVESVHAFGKSITDVGNITDVLTSVSSKSNVSVHVLAEGLKSAAVTGELLGLTFNETAAAVATLEKRGLTIQPLSTALTALYEPSKKVSEALKRNGLDLHEASGEFKTFTQVITELSQKLNDTKEPALLLKDLGVSPRGQKAIESFKDLKDFLESLKSATESAGFAFQAIAVKADTVEGQFKRLASTTEGTLNKAFQASAPALQSILLDLTDLAKSDGVLTFFRTLTTAAASLTGVLVTHAGAIAAAVAAYAGFRILTGLITSFEAFRVAQLAAAAQVEATTLAVRTQALALGANQVQAAASAARAIELGAAGVTAGAGLTVAARGAQLFTLALGYIGVAITAATVAYELYLALFPEQDETQTKLLNTSRSLADSYDQEISRLKELQAQLSLTGETGVRSLGAVHLASLQLQQASVKAQITTLAAQPKEEGFGELGGRSDQSTKLTSLKSDLAEITKQIDAQVARDAELHKQQAGAAQAQDFAALAKRLSALNENVEHSSVAKVQAYRPEIEALQALTTTQENYAGKLLLVADAERKIKDAKPTPIGTPDKSAATDALNAAIARAALAKDLLKIEQQTANLRLEAQKTSGQVGELEYLRQKNDLAHKAADADIAQARADIDLVKGTENKLAAQQKYQNQLEVGRQKGIEADLQLSVAEDAYLAKTQKDNLATEADMYKKKGELLKAYISEFESKYGSLIKGLTTSLEGGGRLGRAEESLISAQTSEEYAAALKEYNLALQETIRLQNLLGEKKAGEAFSLAAQASKAFAESISNLDIQLNTLKASSEGAGLSTIFRDAQTAQETYAASLPALVQMQKQLQAAATASGRPEDQKAANTAQQGILDAAAKVRAAWTATGTAIGQSLTVAFGKGGTALGGLLSATISYSNKRKEIDERLANSDQDPVKLAQAAQRASADSASAQISYYANVAGAAKSYFDQGSTGYQALGAAEKAFHLVELAETFRVFAAKSATITGLLGLKVATDAESIASEGAYTASSLVLTAARSAARGVEAAVSAMAGWPFPLNFIALGATIAAVAALGIKITGGGGGSAPSSSAQRQSTVGSGLNPNGTLNGGGILGDPAAKSDSIANSLKNIEKDSGLGLAHTISMDTSLKQLVAGIGGLASLLVRGTNLSAPVAGNTQGAAQSFVNSGLGTFALGGYFGTIINKLTGGLASGIIGKIAGAIFGGASSVQDVGIKIDPVYVGNISKGIAANQYTDTKTTGGLFSSDKYRTQYTGLGAEVNSQFALVFKNLTDTVSAAATALGLGGDAFTQHLSSFIIDIKEISTKGLTGDEIQKALENALSKLGDDIAKFGVSGLEQFQKVGEGYLETLTRVANDFIQVSDVLAVLGKSFNVTGIAAINLSEDLITSAGGLQALTTNTKFFVDNFLSESERMAPVIKSVQSALASLGQPNVTTADQFKNLVLAQDLNTSAGQALYAALIALAPQFKQITDYASELAGVKIKSSADIRSERSNLQSELDQLTLTSVELLAKQRAGLDESNRALFDQVQAHKDLQTAYANESKSLQDTIDKTKSFVDTLKKFKGDLLIGASSPLTPQEKYQEAKRQFDSAAVAAQGGDATAQANFTNAAQAFLQASQVANASSNQYVSDFAYVRQVTDKTQATAQQQVDVATASLNALRSQVSGLLQIDASVKTVSSAIADLARSLGQSPTTATTNQRSSIDQLYTSLLGRHGEEAGIQFWSNILNQGRSISDIAQDFTKTPEYAQYHSQGATNSAVPMYGKITDVSSMTDILARLDALIQAGTQTAAQLKDLKDAQEALTAAQIDANFQANQQAAQAVVDATNNAAASVRAAQESRVVPA